MAKTTPQPVILKDGFSSLEAGIDYSLPPDLIADNQDSLAINTSFRGGYPHPRPGVRKIGLKFADEGVSSRFKTGIFQRGGYFDPGSGQPQVIMVNIGGDTFRMNLSTNNLVEIVTISGDRNNRNSNMGWCVQADNCWVYQNGIQGALVFNGTSLRRAKGDTDVPQGTAMAYEFNRLWVARGLDYFAGDIKLGGPPQHGDGTNVTSFTENQYLNEGGSFFVPSPHNEITAMKGVANLNTALGTSDLAVYTANGMWLNACPPDRNTWKDTAIQRVGLLDNGAVNQDVISINGDHWFRSEDGFRSGKMSVRNFDAWGNVPQSGEIRRILDADSQALLQFGSGVLFDNRFIHTVSPVRTNQGIYHRGLSVLDFDLVSRMRNTFPPAWEGVWVFDRILQVIVGRFANERRCFAFVLSIQNEIELWEISSDEHHDNYDTVATPIAWGQEMKKFSFGDGDLFKKLEGESFLNVQDMEGRVYFDIYYRSDDNPCWQFWHSFSEAAKASDCPPSSCVPTVYKPQGRKNLRLPMPADTCDPVSGRPNRTGYQFQAKVLINGYCTLKRFELKASVLDPEIKAESPCLGDAPEKVASCCSDPFSWDSYGVLGPVVGVGGGVIQGVPTTLFPTPDAPPPIPPSPPIVPPTPPPVAPDNPQVNPNRNLSGISNPDTIPGANRFCSIWKFPLDLKTFVTTDEEEFAYKVIRYEFLAFLNTLGLPTDNTGNVLDQYGVPIIYQVPHLVSSNPPTVVYDAQGQPIYLGIGNVRWVPFYSGDTLTQQWGPYKYNTGNPLPDAGDAALVLPLQSGNQMCLWWFN